MLFLLVYFVFLYIYLTGDIMINVGDLVTRKSHGNDIVFKVIKIEDDVCYLKGTDIRLYADSPMDDLVMVVEKSEDEFYEKVRNFNCLNRDDYFYLPGKILHIDGDEDYLNKCLKFYTDNNIWAIGVKESEANIASRIHELLDEHNPNIVVITGHDAYYKKKGDINNIEAYKNSINFVKAVKEARRYEKSHDKLIVIAGACQSDYEELIKAGANFASSPKRINIHALDPAIIAASISLLEVSEDINLKELLDKTKYGSLGIGGIKTKGTMYVGYPR